MKIGIDARLWGESGIGRYIRNLIKYLQVFDKKNEYVLFVLSKDRNEITSQLSTLPLRREASNFQLVIADIRWHTVKEQFYFPKILNDAQLDLAHFPYFSVPIFYSRPFVVTVHDLILHHFPTGEASTLPFAFYQMKRLGYHFVISQAAMHAKKILAVSNSTKQEIIDHLGVNQNKIVVTYEGVDQKISNSRLQLPSQSDGGQVKFQISNKEIKVKKYFLYVGNAYPHKNVEGLIAAFLELIKHEKDAKLLLVGKEDYFYKRLKARFGSNPSIQFKGFVSDWELTTLYQNALALICPSFMEGFGLTGLEAMANNCLVIASDIPVHREIYADAAMYFDPHNTKDIVEEMKDICSNDSNLQSKMIKAGLERVKIFSWEKMAKETIAVYESSASASSA